MYKKNIKKIVIVSVISIIIIAGIGFGAYKYNKVQAYNNLITTANKYMNQDYYDKASALFEESLKYKKDSLIEKNIKLAVSLEKFKQIYNDGIKLQSDKKYLEAIEKFKVIDKSGLKWYNNGQKKIEECKKQYISQNMQLANDAVKNSEYDNANKYLDDILKIDSNNKDAENLKTLIDKIVKEQKEKAELEEEQASQNKTKENNNNQASNIQNNNTKSNNVQNNSNEVNSTQNEIVNKIKSLDNQIHNLEVQMKGMDTSSDDYINALKEENSLIRQRINLVNQLQ